VSFADGEDVIKSISTTPGRLLSPMNATNSTKQLTKEPKDQRNEAPLEHPLRYEHIVETQRSKKTPQLPERKICVRLRFSSVSGIPESSSTTTTSISDVLPRKAVRGQNALD